MSTKTSQPDLASPAPVAAVAVSVKGLEWELFEYKNYVSRTPFGAYEVQELRDGSVRTRFGSTAFEPFEGTLEAAKAAAQADFNARILSSIIPAAKGAVGVEAYKAKNAKNGWTGRGFSFDPGFLNLDREGAATIGFAESDMQYERADDTGKDYVYCNVTVNEIIALRDYLNEAFPFASLSGGTATPNSSLAFEDSPDWVPWEGAAAIVSEGKILAWTTSDDEAKQMVRSVLVATPPAQTAAVDGENMRQAAIDAIDALSGQYLPGGCSDAKTILRRAREAVAALPQPDVEGEAVAKLAVYEAFGGRRKISVDASMTEQLDVGEYKLYTRPSAPDAGVRESLHSCVCLLETMAESARDRGDDAEWSMMSVMAESGRAALSLAAKREQPNG